MINTGVFRRIKETVYGKCGFDCIQCFEDRESREYEAIDFKILDRHIKYRIGKITPIKVGQFVTLYKRLESGKIGPIDSRDSVDTVVVHVVTSEKEGQFVFPKKILLEKGIFSKEGVGGKRAMRIYPPWYAVQSTQARKTQSWQCKYFFEIDKEGSFDCEKVKQLFRM